MRQLDTLHIAYTPYDLEITEFTDGLELANRIGKDPNTVFKSLVTVSNDKDHFMFIIPVNGHLSMKKAAKAAGKKKVEMIHQKDLLPLTGYVHGGCSPLGLKKPMPVFVDQSAEGLSTMCVSGGKIGVHVELAPADLLSAVHGEFADLLEEQ